MTAFTWEIHFFPVISSAAETEGEVSIVVEEVTAKKKWHCLYRCVQQSVFRVRKVVVRVYVLSTRLIADVAACPTMSVAGTMQGHIGRRDSSYRTSSKYRWPGMWLGSALGL